MSFSDDFKALQDDLLVLTGPDNFDIRKSQLTVRTRTWSGGERGSGTPVDSDLVVNQYYGFRRVSASEISSSGGNYESGDIIVGPITPNYTTASESGGYSETQLAPKTNSLGVEFLYIVTGQHAGTYKLLEIRSLKTFGYELVLRRSRVTP